MRRGARVCAAALGTDEPLAARSGVGEGRRLRVGERAQGRVDGARGGVVGQRGNFVVRGGRGVGGEVLGGGS